MNPRTGRPCQVCSHPDREAIEQAILNGKSQREVARTFTIGYNRDDPERFYPDNKIVARHMDDCMGDAYRAVQAEDAAASGRAMLYRLHRLDEVVDEQIARLREGTVVKMDGVPLLDDDGRPVRRFSEADIRGAVREARRNLELRSRLAGVTPEGDPDAADDARRALTDPMIRKAISDVEQMLGDVAGSPRPGVE